MNLPNRKLIHETIQSAIRHIKNVQQPCGSFLSLSSPSPTDFSNAIPYSTTFFTSNILSCLSTVASFSPNETLSLKTKDDLKTIILRGAEFLLGEKNEQWSFNYFAHEERTREIFSYPDDLDDTFAAFVALHKYRPEIFSGNVLAAAIKLLIGTEIREGGPYRTWVVPSNAVGIANDPDIVVNSTIGYFLSLLDVHSPRIGAYVMDMIRHKRCFSPYYPGPCQIAYFTSRYQGAGNMPPFLFSEISANAFTPLESAMLISSFFHGNHSKNIPPFMADRLANAVRTYGWRPYPFCIDPARDHKTFYAGASALTAAFVAEALVRCSSIPPKSRSKSSFIITVPVTAPAVISFHHTIRNIAIHACSSLPQNLGAIAVEKIEGASTNMVITAPSYDLKKVLEGKGFIIPKTVSQDIALANLYGWLAYDSYDDSLDGEGSAPSLSVANYFLRKLTQIYANLAVGTAPRSPLVALFDKMLNTMDGANIWEIAHCRISIHEKFSLPEMIPSYGNHDNLAERSIGYAIGPLAELLIAGYLPESKEYRTIERFFKHYLIARQLHDDAHDWEDDLFRGSINSIGALLINNYRERFPERANAAIAEILVSMREFFWKETLDQAVTLIHAHLEKARVARDTCTFFDGTGFMEDALGTLERGAAKAITERDRMLEFLAHF